MRQKSGTETYGGETRQQHSPSCIVRGLNAQRQRRSLVVSLIILTTTKHPPPSPFVTKTVEILKAIVLSCGHGLGCCFL